MTIAALAFVAVAITHGGKFFLRERNRKLDRARMKTRNIMGVT